MASHSVAIQSDCDRIADNLARHAGKLGTQVVATTGWAERSCCWSNLLWFLYVMVTQLNHCHFGRDWKPPYWTSRIKDEIVALKCQMAQVLQERANSGKCYEEVSKWQQHCKLSHLRNTAEAALGFAETFGSIPDQLTTHTTHSGEQVVVNFAENKSPLSVGSASTTHHPDEFCAMQMYLLDRFVVLTSFIMNLPR